MAEPGPADRGSVVAEELAHFGVKGMRWGVRRSESQLARVGSTDSDVTVKAKGGKIKGASGGSATKPSEDALNAAVAKQRLKKGSIDSLSNEELNTLVKRMELESKFYTLNTKSKEATKSKGRKFVDNFIDETIKNESGKLARGDATATGQRIKKVLASAAAKKAVATVTKKAGR